MPLPAQLFNDTNKDMLVSLRIDGELFSKKFSRRPFRVVKHTVGLNIYSEPNISRAEFEAPVDVPFRLKLEPTEDDLTKYGITEKRDALATFCRYLMEETFGITPKIGDRFDHVFQDATGSTFIEQYEIKDVKRTDPFRDSGYPMRFVCGASKTTKAVEV